MLYIICTPEKFKLISIIKLILRNVIMSRIKFVIQIFFLFLFTCNANAGLIYTNQAAFDAAASGLTSAWTEDFESFLQGPSADPLGIGGGQAEIVDGGNPSIINFGPTGLSWLQPGGSNSNAIIRGLGNTSLGLNAISFNFGNQVIQTIDFLHTSGTDTSPSYGSNGGLTDRFVGWIGSGSELLSLTQFVQTQGITVDNVRAYTSVPEPASFALFGLCLMGLARRKRT